ncbi:MAG: phosphomannomutase/phosphoglucomutase [Acidimicrobiia bacterium]|nr:phosphomannomutase/phosphoglucomutase [Acidimicrobiia bacterium]
MGELEKIVKAYDVRGRTDTGELDVDAASRLGAGFAHFVGTPQVAVGRDCRTSSPAIASAFIDGARSEGVGVVELGEVATDMVYYYSGVADMPGAVITASHNPAEYNGIKMCHRAAAPIGADTGLRTIKEYAESVEVGSPVGTIETVDPRAGYVDHVLGLVDADIIAPLTVACDGGNGMAGVVLEDVFGRLRAELLGLYLEPDGTFPNHPADPLDPDNLVDLMDFMQRHAPDLGVAFDGDADRAFFIDDQRAPVPGSTTTAIIADWFLAREPGATVVHNLITSRAVPETIERAGGKPVRTRVGHSYIKQVMAETGAVFGGEHSGHYYFRDNFRADSGMLAMLVLLQVLSEAGEPLSVLRTRYEPYAVSGEINTRVADQAAAMNRVAEAFSNGSHDFLDGLTVSFEDRWFNLRPSNTEPLLRLNVEAPDPDAVADLVENVRDVIAGG